MTKRFNENYKTMQTRKFWCHYIGSDGNTPKRRNIELTNLSELLPNIGNEKAKTPLWYEREEEDEGYRTYVQYFIYAQLSDKVAAMITVVSASFVERMQPTDEEIEADGKKSWQKFLTEHPDASDDYKAKERKWNEENMEGRKKDRDNLLARLKLTMDYDNYLLSVSSWVKCSDIRAYEEVQSPILSGLKELRAMGLERREEEERQRKEAAAKAREEEARKQAEAEAREQERLTQEAEKFKNGESIAGADVVELCRRYGISVHLRTVHNLQQVIANINGKEQTCQYYRTRGKRRPQLDGCYKTATELYNYLQTA